MGVCVCISFRVTLLATGGRAWPAHDLQLLQRPQIVSDVRDRLDGDALVDRLHLLRPHLRDPNPDRELFTLRIERDGRPREQRRVRRGELPARGRQTGTHHVCAREQEPDRAAVYADVWQHEWICNVEFFWISLHLSPGDKHDGEKEGSHLHLWSRRSVGR